MRKYDAVIFDFDGTIVDTGEGIIKSLIYSLEKHCVPVPGMEQLRRFIGPPIYDSYINDYGATPENVHSFISAYRERYFVLGVRECELYDGVMEMLLALKAAGCLLAVASSKPEKLVHDVIETVKLDGVFNCVCGTSLDETVHTTKAQLIAGAMERLGVSDKARVLMVGDRCFDIEGATQVGVDSAGMLYGYGSREEFESNGATYIFSTAGELCSAVAEA